MEMNPCCVCGTEVTTDAISSDYKDKIYYFCSVVCKEKFDKEPEKYFVKQHVM